LCNTARALDADALAPQAVLARLRFLRAKSERAAGRDPRPLLEETVAALRTLTQASQSPADLLLLAQGTVMLAGLEQREHKDPATLADEALAALERSGSERSGPEGRRTQAAVHLVLAQRQLSQGEDPQTECELARAALGGPQAAGASRPSAALLAVEIAEVELRGKLARTEPGLLDAIAQTESWARKVLAGGSPCPALARASERLEALAREAR
jgi:hypothetical protein